MLNRVGLWLMVVAVLVAVGVSGGARADLTDEILGEDVSFFDVNNTYLSVMGGVSMIDDWEVPVSGLAFDLENDDGFLGSVALGLDFGVPRIEIEGTYRENSLDDLSFSLPPGAASLTGDLWSVSLMGNVYMDWAVNKWLDLYIGGGVGAVYLDADINGSYTLDGLTTTVVSGDESLSFAFQGMLGAGIELSRGVMLVGQYRVFSFDDPDFEGLNLDAPLSHEFMVGLRFAW